MPLNKEVGELKIANSFMNWNNHFLHTAHFCNAGLSNLIYEITNAIKIIIISFYHTKKFGCQLTDRLIIHARHLLATHEYIIIYQLRSY